MSWIKTYTGKKYELLNPSYKNVDLEDIAHALSMICRYTGHTAFFYSVAQHCLYGVNKMIEDGITSNKILLYFLLHDATEAWYNDLARPLKALLPEYVALEKKAEAEVWKAFSLPQPTEEEWAIVKYYDDLMLANEIPKLMLDPEEFEVELRDDNIDIKESKMEDVEAVFILTTLAFLAAYKMGMVKEVATHA